MFLSAELPLWCAFKVAVAQQAKANHPVCEQIGVRRPQQACLTMLELKEEMNQAAKPGTKQGVTRAQQLGFNYPSQVCAAFASRRPQSRERACDKLAQEEGGGGHGSENPLPPLRGH